MRFTMTGAAASRTFADRAEFMCNASQDDPEVRIFCGIPPAWDPGLRCVMVELGSECLGVHTGDGPETATSNVVGFSRYANGSEKPSELVELVRQVGTSEDAVEAARALLTAAGFTVVVCSDQAGRIVDRLVRPKYNAALRFVDEGLASGPDIDATCRLGLGYPTGPIERVLAGGLEEHYLVSRSLFEATGSTGYVPARRAAVAHERGRSS